MSHAEVTSRRQVDAKRPRLIFNGRVDSSLAQRASTFSAADVGTGRRTVPDGQRTLSNLNHIAWLMMMTKENYEGRSIEAGISL
jgi:hypothetical protein